MTSQADTPAAFSQEGAELCLSGPALAELLQAVLARGVPFRFRARGMSMHPFIKDGDVITVSPLAGRAPATGEIVAFQRDARHLVVHRIVAVSGGAYVIQGDSQLAADDHVARDHVIGRVVRAERNGRPVRLATGLAGRAVALLTRSGIFARAVVPLWLRVRFLFRR